LRDLPETRLVPLQRAGEGILRQRGGPISRAAQLKNHPKISFFSNENDFLLRSEDVAWLKSLLGERAYFFERGGHLGNVSNQDVREAISRKVQQDKLR
jgi:hypothetical protein